MNTKQKRGLLVLTECSIMIALSTVLSIVEIFRMPYGGSITLASMLPIVILAFRHGVGVGSGSALVASLIQLLLGLKNFQPFTTWQSIIALALFDYVLAFTVFGTVGFFKRIIKQQAISMTVGAALASLIRYLCHVISGATIWAGLSIPDEAAIAYSLSYNATYMIPETIILVLCAAYVGSSLDFSKTIPVRVKSQKLDTVASYCYIGAGFSVLGALIADTALVFSKLQNYESGELFGAGIASVNWLAVGIVSGVCFLCAAALFIFARTRTKRSA